MAVWARQVARCGWLRAAGLLGLRSRSGAARACCGAAPLPALLSGHRLPPWRLRVSVDYAQPSRAKGEACAPRSSLPVAVKQEQAAPETVSDLSAAKLYEGKRPQGDLRSMLLLAAFFFFFLFLTCLTEVYKLF